MKNLGKAIVILLVGISGGILGALGFSLIQNHHSSQTTITTAGKELISNKSYDNQTSTTAAVNKVKDAVVSVINYQEGNSSQASEFANEAGMVASSEGSGIIYQKENGKAYVVTNEHVVNGAKQLEVLLSSGDQVKGKLVGSDVYSDLAVIEIDADKVQSVAEFADSDTVNVGEVAIAIGSPLGTEFANTVTQGIVSGVGRQMTNQNDNGQTVSINAIQTDAAINPGNSGGALINIEGQVIGINESKMTADYSGNTNVEGIGFAIPSNDAVAIISLLQKGQKISRPAIGIQMKDVANTTASEKKKANIDKDQIKTGIVVFQVIQGMPADGILKDYDVITAIDGKEVATTTDLQSELYKHQVGDKVELTIIRDGKEETVQLTLDKTRDQLENQD